MKTETLLLLGLGALILLGQRQQSSGPSNVYTIDPGSGTVWQNGRPAGMQTSDRVNAIVDASQGLFSSIYQGFA